MSASIMMSCSMIHSLIGAVWLWMTKASRAADGLLVAHVDLAVGEVVGRLVGTSSVPSAFGDLLGELRVRPAGEDHEVLLGRLVDAAHRWAPFVSVVGSLAPRRPSRPAWRSSVFVPARRRATQPSMLRCWARVTASWPGATSLTTAEPAAT